MPAPFPVKAVANAILQKSFAEGRAVTPLALQKLVYYAHGYFSGACDTPLVNEPFEAWQYGPVIPSLYREFRDFGNSRITRLATEEDWFSESNEPVPSNFDDGRAQQVLDYVWKTYSNRTPIALSELTHKPGGPWDQTKKANPSLVNADIPQGTIASYFKQFIKAPARAT